MRVRQLTGNASLRHVYGLLEYIQMGKTCLKVASICTFKPCHSCVTLSNAIPASTQVLPCFNAVLPALVVNGSVHYETTDYCQQSCKLMYPYQHQVYLQHPAGIIVLLSSTHYSGPKLKRRGQRVSRPSIETGRTKVFW